MFKLKHICRNILSSKCLMAPISKNILCLIIGLIIGIRFSDMWFSLLSEKDPIPEISSSSSSSMTSSSMTATDPNTHQMLPEYLFNTTRVLCWIMTNPDNHLKKAVHIRNTWGRRCNKLLFMSTAEDDELKTIKLSVEEGRKNLWNKTKESLKYIYDHHYEDAEWFLKADDDTYFIMENLRFFLYPYPAEAPIYFGAKFKPYVKQGYMSGGAGYVLSKEALRRFATESYNDTKKCSKSYRSEDVQLGICLQNVGVMAGDTRDVEGNERFLPFAPDYFIPNVKKSWYQKYTYYQQKENATCCSPSVISFHYMRPNNLYIMDYLLYILRPLGHFENFNLTLPQKLNLSDIAYESETTTTTEKTTTVLTKILSTVKEKKLKTSFN